MGKFHVVYFGSNEVPVALIKPILDEIGADMTIRCPTNDAEVVEMGKDANGIIMHGSVPLTREIISQLKRTKVVARTGACVDRMDLKAAKDVWRGAVQGDEEHGLSHQLRARRAGGFRRVARCSSRR